ncbi:hypothetical protein Tco_0370955 [Tanacetum coccineum]
MKQHQMAKTDVCDRSTGVIPLDSQVIPQNRSRVSRELALPLTKLKRRARRFFGFQIYSDPSKKGLGCVTSSMESDCYALRQLSPMRRWLELLKDYDTNIHYHPIKGNVVADALRRKLGMIAGIKIKTSQKDDGENKEAIIQKFDQQTEFPH